MKGLLMAMAALYATGMAAADFDSCFKDRTLRLDYKFGADSTHRYVLLDRMSTSPGWAGRRSNLSRLPYEGDGNITLIDEASGDTIYRTGFSSLYHEWLSTGEAQTTPRSFHNIFLVPQPLSRTRIDVTLNDARRRPMAKMSHVYDPAEILIPPTDSIKPNRHRYLHKVAKGLDKAIDVAILGEGYTVAEMDSFYVHAQRTVDALLGYEPFKSMADRFNFVAVESPSMESGVSIPRTGDWKQTAFDSHFSTFHSDRYLTTDRLDKVHDALTNIPYEHIIILANTEEYGGGGIYNSYEMTAARHPQFRPVVVHEFGHSFGALDDEYFYDDDVMTDTYPTDVEPWKPNLTTLIEFDSKWKRDLKPGTPIPTDPKDARKYPIGVYEGGGYSSKGIYRPADECRMRNNTYPTFCPVCEKSIRRLVEFYTE